MVKWQIGVVLLFSFTVKFGCTAIDRQRVLEIAHVASKAACKAEPIIDTVKTGGWLMGSDTSSNSKTVVTITINSPDTVVTSTVW